MQSARFIPLELADLMQEELVENNEATYKGETPFYRLHIFVGILITIV